jgi:hypothetical protein
MHNTALVSLAIDRNNNNFITFHCFNDIGTPLQNFEQNLTRNMDVYGMARHMHAPAGGNSGVAALAALVLQLLQHTVGASGVAAVSAPPPSLAGPPPSPSSPLHHRVLLLLKEDKVTVLPGRGVFLHHLHPVGQ